MAAQGRPAAGSAQAHPQLCRVRAQLCRVRAMLPSASNMSLPALLSFTPSVARALRITPKTADNHIQAIYGKAGVRSRAAAILFAMRHGLVDALDG